MLPVIVHHEVGGTGISHVQMGLSGVLFTLEPESYEQAWP